MKISKLYIDEYKHLKNLNFDFTYPMDFHDETMRGKPLNKICFIGQSGTGKTGLLEMIRGEIFSNVKKTDSKNSLTFFNGLKNITSSGIFLKDFTEFFNKEKIKLVYFPSELNINSIIKIFGKDYSNIFSDLNKKRIIEDSIENFLTQKNIIIDGNIEVLWDFILFELQDYSERLKQLGNIISSETNTSNFTKTIEEWKKNNPNPYTSLGKLCLNPILKKLNLELSTTLEKNKLISIKSINNENPISTKSLSTGTKQLLLTALPLYKLDTKESIILIDEPERSLYPDMQMDLMDYYQNLAPEAQFIIATHSPFIAASFEPCERFILYFDEEGKVAVRQGTSPIGDDPNDIVYEDFGVNYYNKNTQEKFKEYIELLDKAREEIDKEKKKNYILKATKIGDLYNFDINEKNIQRHQ